MSRSSGASVTSHSDSVKHTRQVIKAIFFSFIVTLPFFHTLFLVFKRSTPRKPSSEYLYHKHGLAG